MNEVVVPSPAKINLFLEIIGRRPDGYHDIASIMQLVDLCDEVRLRRRRTGIRVEVQGAELSAGRGNLAYRAAALLLEAAGVEGGVEIHLEKRIPVAGGLGGGSSNAAAVLIGLSRLYELAWSPEALQKLGENLGSDVPFFLGDGLALATGRGEILTPLSPWPPQWLVLANPGLPISTAWAYREASSKLTEWQPRVNIPSFPLDGRLQWPPVWAFNRLESAVLPHRPEIAALKDLLREAGGAPVLMSGSGASVFAVVSDAVSARQLAAQAEKSGAFAAAVTTLPANPMWEARG
ncbi:MAG: 4-(cytidine 5'-diphospho)-2-C-methyl-D-erythritol kinase [candidate division NC10 bacterium]